MALFPEIAVDAIFLSRTDAEECLSSFADFPFMLEDRQWPTVEHYFQAKKCVDKVDEERIRLAFTAKKARQMGRSRRLRMRKDWSEIKVTIMTRAIYTCARTHDEVNSALLESGGKTYFESNNYDYYWGCGRDRRGGNHYGKVLMQVRKKLQAESISG